MFLWVQVNINLCYTVYMNEKVAKKIGEAYAFAHVLSDTFSENTEVMTLVFGGYAENIIETTQSQRMNLKSIIEKYSMTEMVLEKAERTGSKISGMGQTYVGDDWDDAAEVLEWMSFFVGGAIVHWQLIAGSAEEMNDHEFKTCAERGTEYYTNLMKQLRSFATNIGKQRA